MLFIWLAPVGFEFLNCRASLAVAELEEPCFFNTIGLHNHANLNKPSFGVKDSQSYPDVLHVWRWSFKMEHDGEFEG
jgi:hypothetical protein